MRFFRRTRRFGSVDPDEIFLDVSNLPEFDYSQMEGRLERPIGKRTLVVFGTIICLSLFGLSVRAYTLQVVSGEAYTTQSEQNRLDAHTLFASRGLIRDRNGVVLVDNVRKEEGLFAHRSYKTPGFAHVLGYVSYPRRDSAGFFFTEETVGIVGIEKEFDAQLRGTNGRLLKETDALGRVYSEGIVVQPKDGNDVILALDSVLQEAMFASIQKFARQIPFQGGAGVLIDIQNGEVLSLVSYPEYDANILSYGADAGAILGYQEDTRTPFLNRALSGRFTPGSIIKPFIAAFALSEGVVSPETSILSTGAISIPNPYNPNNPSVFRDWRVQGWVDVRRALAVSSNVYFYAIGGGYGTQKGIGIDGIGTTFARFGLTEKTGVEFPDEVVGFVPSPLWKEQTFNEPWRLGDTYHTAIGQYASLVTPLGMARATAGLASGGTLPSLTLIKGEQSGGRSIPVDPSALLIAREGMRDAVKDGTARAVDVSYVEIAAKTGTAEVGVSKDLVHSWIIGFYPYENPKYAFVIVMERGARTNLIGAPAVARDFFDTLNRTSPEYFTNLR